MNWRRAYLSRGRWCWQTDHGPIQQASRHPARASSLEQLLRVRSYLESMGRTSNKTGSISCSLCRRWLLPRIRLKRHACLMTEQPRRPGDLLLARYFPNADEETRERAREAFREWALLILRIGRSVRDAQSTASNSQAENRRHTVPSAPGEPPPA